ncbi:MAG: Tuberous sclerosis 2-like protein [Pleopsidium flavum]|nr:MAG: Tuberous sclerosis 2-like protein [Pleopsidium flavum]
MPPSPKHIPQTPETKNSQSSLTNVFKNFASGRQKPSVSGPSTATPTGTATPPPLSRIRSRGGGLEGHEGRSSLAQPKDPHGTMTNFDQLLESLRRGHALTERIAAAEQARVVVQGYPIELATRLWSAAEDLIGKDCSPESRKAGFELLLSYTTHEALGYIERKNLFEVLSTPYIPDDFHLQLSALAELTNNRRNLEALESPLISMLPSWLEDCSTAARVSNKKEKSSRQSGPLREETDLDQLFKFIISIIKSSPGVFEEQDLVALLQQTSLICRKTTSEADVENSIDVLDAVTTFSYIPASVLDTCVEVLCAIYGTVTSLAEPTWNALHSLLRSSLRDETITVLLNILRASSEQCGRAFLNTIRGALYVMKNLIYSNGAGDLPILPIATIVDALRKPLETNSARIDVVVVQTLGSLFENEDTTQMVLAEDWTNLIEVLLLSFRRELEKDNNELPVDFNTNAAQSSSTKTIKESTGLSQGLLQVINDLEFIWPRLSSTQKEMVAKFFIKVHSRLTIQSAELLIKYYAEERLCYHTNVDCLRNLDDLVTFFVVDQAWPASTRSIAINTAKDGFENLRVKHSMRSLSQYFEQVLRCASSEKEVLVLESLAEFIVDVAVIVDDELFGLVIPALKDCSFQEGNVSTMPVRSIRPLTSPSSHPSSSKETLPPQSPANVAVKTLVRILLRSLHASASKVERILGVLLDIARSKTCESDARLTAMKLLFRLRSDSDHSILVVSTSESEDLAASLYRTVDTGFGARKGEESSRDRTDRTARSDDSNTARLGRSTSVNQPQAYVTKANTRSTSGPGRPTKLTPPLWMYPGPKGLPEDPPTAASPFLCSTLETFSKSISDDAISGERTVLTLNVWLEVVIGLLQQGGDWEVYSYVLVHLGAQLANPSLFKSAIPQIKLLRNVLCEQMQATSFHDPPAATGLKKADVAICILHNITMLLGYHEHFARSEEDEIVRTFISGIGSWDRTSKICVHALLICCHEIPLSVTRSLNAILQKMSQIITQSRVAMHILEFLGGLARLPDVYVSLREDELRTVFGICARYLQYSREERQKTPTAPSTRTSHTSNRLSGTAKDFASVTESDHYQTASNDLPQYVYALAYHVMTFWFLSLKLPDRAKHVGWIAKNLVWTDDTGVEIIEEQSQVTIDMMQRTAYSDLGETAPKLNFASTVDGDIMKKTWLVGMSILTVETAVTSGLSQITKRQASGTTHAIYQQQTAALPPHHVPSPTDTIFEAEDASSHLNVFPSHVLLQLMSTVAPNPVSMQPILLPDDDAIRRAISTFDRNDTVDGHKVGVIYIGRGQTTESEILANVEGSDDYTSFLAGLGTKVALKGANFNTQGLDRESNMDGEFTYAWRDRVTEIVFHITTMMPTDLEHDSQCVNKKRHIGNGFVNVIFNRSNLPFHFDTFPSQFNYVNIVISPEAGISPFEEDQSNRPTDTGTEDRYYKVQTLSRADFPSISPAAETKLISAKVLPAFVRLLALNASVFSLVWARREDGGEHVSSWRNRLREIVKLRERYSGLAHGTGSGKAGGKKGSNIAFAEGAGHRGSMVSVESANEGESVVEGLDFSKWTL